MNDTLQAWVVSESLVKFPKTTYWNIDQLMSTKKYVVLAVLAEDKIGMLTDEMKA